MTQVKVDMTFPHNYIARVLEAVEINSAGWRHFYFPGASRDGGRDGLMVEVQPETGDPWVGTFAVGYASPSVLSAMHTCPDPKSLCIVSRGAGYLVNAGDPEDHTEMDCFPITGSLSMPACDLLVVWDFTSIAAYGAEGWRWTTPARHWDGIDVIRADGHFLFGRGWDPALADYVEFSVDLRTGHYT